MLFNLFITLTESFSFLNVFKYLTFRTGLSVITSLVIVFIIGGPLIKYFSKNQITFDIPSIMLLVILFKPVAFEPLIIK